jgi:D-alanyl-D-alanine carboxypeptidase
MLTGILLVIGLGACTGGGENPARTEATSSASTTIVRPAPAPSSDTLDPVKAKALQRVLTSAVALYSSIPDASKAARGLTAALVTDRWIWSGAAGRDARGARLTPATMLAAGSITKTFVAAEVMRLARAGKVDLDAPISRYVVHPLTGNGATVRQHLSMRSGVANFSPNDEKRLDAAIALAPRQHWTAEDTLALHPGTIGPPATFEYSNPNYSLLAMLIEKVTGRRLADVLRTDFARPAGLRRVAFQDDETPLPPIAEEAQYPCGKAVDGFIPCRAYASMARGSGSLAADAPSVARWGYELYGARLLPADVVGQMMSGTDEYGLGTMRYTNLFGLDQSYGHNGFVTGYTSVLVVIPEHHLSVAVMVAGEKDVDSFARELITAAQPLLGS